MDNPVIRWTKTSATWLERAIALAIFVGIIPFAVHSARELIGMDWGSTETFYALIYRILLIVIAVELIRTLVTHDLAAVLELIAFVVARKMLKPDLTSLDIAICALAFVALLAAYRHLLIRRDESR